MDTNVEMICHSRLNISEKRINMWVAMENGAKQLETKKRGFNLHLNLNLLQKDERYEFHFECLSCSDVSSFESCSNSCADFIGEFYFFQ